MSDNQESNPMGDNSDYEDPIIEKVSAWKVMFGKHKGLTYGTMAKDNMRYLKWMRKNDICKNQDVNDFIDLVM